MSPETATTPEVDLTEADLIRRKVSLFFEGVDTSESGMVQNGVIDVQIDRGEDSLGLLAAVNGELLAYYEKEGNIESYHLLGIAHPGFKQTRAELKVENGVESITYEYNGKVTTNRIDVMDILNGLGLRNF